MGKDFRRFNKDDEYCDVQQARKNYNNRHEKRLNSRTINIEDDRNDRPNDKYKKGR